MDQSEQIAQAVEKLVRLHLLQDGDHSSGHGDYAANGDYMDLDSDDDIVKDADARADRAMNKAAYEERVKAAQEYCLRILESRLEPSLASDDMHISDLIKKKLMREDASSAKAIRFSHLYTKLSACSLLSKKWSILYFLLTVSDQSSASLASTSTSNPPRNNMDHRPLSFLGIHNLNTTRARGQERDRNQDRGRIRIVQSDATMVAHSIHESVHTAPPGSYGRQTSAPASHAAGSPGSLYTNLLNDPSRRTHPEVEESALLRDLIFVFQGIDGKMIKFDAESGTCSIDPTVHISNSTRSLVNRLTELGLLYKNIDNYVQTILAERTVGLVVQSFCSALQHELVDYFRLIAVLEAHIAKDTDKDKSKGLSLKRLLVWTQESLQRLQLMSVLVESCHNLQGGALVRKVHDYTQNGDPFIKQFVHHMLERISAPFYVMMQRWIYEGELEDPRKEFFIAYDPDFENEDMWQRKYFIRESMLPAFIGMSLAKKYGDIAELEGSIDAAYLGTSRRLLHLLTTKFKLVDHLTAIKRYILLGQGDFIQQLMESLGSNLSQKADTLFRHNLTGKLETAVRSSNAQFDDPDVLRRLDVRLLEISPEDSGWDVFSLYYLVDADSPISTILTPVAMHQYLKMFNFLWRLKRVEYALSSAWRRQTTSARAIRPILELVPELHHCRIVCSEMIHFIYQLQYYILFEVLECSWDELLKAIENTTDLDALIESHMKYLRDITSKGLLSASRDKNMLPRLQELLATILGYKVAQDNLYDYAMAEIERRKRLVQTADRRTRHGQWGLTDHDETLDRIPDEQFEKDVPGLLRELNDFSMQFKRKLSELLITLSADGDSDLRFLSFRLDFNEFYMGSLKQLKTTGGGRGESRKSTMVGASSIAPR
ncbi:Gamma-tubulin complex component 3 [Mortierella claussenii]|nr:Gamma-tubulin complex component 3 [Mortierella claussenii]